jgi:hypothetical protein
MISSFLLGTAIKPLAMGEKIEMADCGLNPEKCDFFAEQDFNLLNLLNSSSFH